MCTALAPALGCPSPSLAFPAAGTHHSPARGRMAPDTRPPDLLPPAGSGFGVYGVRRNCKVSQNKVSTPPPPQPKEPSREPLPLPHPIPQPDEAWPGSRARLCLCHPWALNGLPVCQSKHDPSGWGRRLRGTRRRTGDFFSLDVPLGRSCQGLCQGICQGAQSAPTLWIHH